MTQYKVTWKLTQTFTRTITAQTEAQALEYARGFSLAQLNYAGAKKSPKHLEVDGIEAVKE